jgi:hypothetical protein
VDRATVSVRGEPGTVANRLDVIGRLRVPIESGADLSRTDVDSIVVVPFLLVVGLAMDRDDSRFRVQVAPSCSERSVLAIQHCWHHCSEGEQRMRA